MYTRGYRRSYQSHTFPETRVGSMLTLAELDAERSDRAHRVGTIGQRGNAIHLLYSNQERTGYFKACGTPGSGEHPAVGLDTRNITCVQCCREVARRTAEHQARLARELLNVAAKRSDWRRASVGSAARVGKD